MSVVAILALVGLSAFFSSSETAIFTLPADWIDEQAARGDVRGRTLQELRHDPHRLLVTILVGNNVVNVAIASITTVVVTEYLPAGSAVSVATVLASFLILIFGEIVPKSYALGRAERYAPAVARPITAVETILYPLVTVFDVVTRWLTARIGGESDIEQPYLNE
jgi:Mg2+/Co2+ transporter CorB